MFIFPHGAVCTHSDAFPGSISDEQLTEQIGVIDYCPTGKVVMTDKGFTMSDLCHEREYITTGYNFKFSSPSFLRGLFSS